MPNVTEPITTSQTNGFVVSLSHVDGGAELEERVTAIEESAGTGGTAISAIAPLSLANATLTLNQTQLVNNLPTASLTERGLMSPAQVAALAAATSGGGGATLTLPAVSLSTAEDVTLNGNVLTNAVTTTAQPIVVTQFTVTHQDVASIYSAGLTAYPSGIGSITVLATGAIVFAPAPNWNGVFAGLSVQATDGTDIRSATITLTTTAVNDAPTAVSDGAATTIDHAVTLNLLSNDSDVEGSTLTLTHIQALPAAVGTPVAVTHGSVVLNANGTVTLTPSEGYSGVVTFTYTVSDGTASTTGNANVLVSAGSGGAVTTILPDPVTQPMVGLRTWHIGPNPENYPAEASNVFHGTDLADVNWAALTAGDVVNVYWRATAYKEKPVVCAIGTAELPVIIWGVTDEFGRRPIIDGDGAVGIPSTQTLLSTNVAYGQSLGLMLVKNPIPYDPKPAWVTVANIEFARCGRHYQYQSFEGDWLLYGNGSGRASALIMGPCDDCTVENCIFRESGQGLFTVARNNDPIECTYRLKVLRCRFYDNGTTNGYLDHNAYVQAVHPLVEGCYFGPERPDAAGSSYKSRSAGEVFRYNWVIGSSRACDWVHGEDTTNSVSADPMYGHDMAYGNVIISSSDIPGSHAGEPIHYGGDNWGEDEPTRPLLVPDEPYRTNLAFFSNTFVMVSSYAQASDPRMFGLSLADVRVDAWDNVMIFQGTSHFSFLEYAGRLHFHGNNYAIVTGGGTLNDAKWDASNATMFTVTRHGGALLTGGANLVDVAGQDYRLATGSAAIGAGSAGTLPSTLPQEVADLVASHYPVAYQPNHSLSGRLARPTTNDLGALEHGVGSGPPPTLPVNTVVPTVTGVTLAGETLTATTGTWTQEPTSYAYQWQSSATGTGTGTNITGATAATHIAGTETYLRVAVTATNAAGESGPAYSEYYAISTASSPAFTLQPTSQTIEDGQTVTLTVAVIGTPTPTRQWQSNNGSGWSDVVGETGLSYTTGVLSSSSTGVQYRCVATNANGVTNSQVATITISLSAEPNASGVFNFARPNGTLLTGVNSSFAVVMNANVQLEVRNGQLRPLVGTGSNGGSYQYPTGHAADDQHIRVRIARLVGGTIYLSVCESADGLTSGYTASISATTIEFRKSGVWQNQVSHGINLSTGSGVFGVDRQGSIVTVTVNGTAVITFDDTTPLTNANETFSITVANVTNATIESLTYTRAATL